MSTMCRMLQLLCNTGYCTPESCVLVCACTKDCTVLMMQKVDDSDAFDRTWNEFKVGFGVTSGNYWLGNDQIHQLTKDGGYILRVDTESNDGGSGPTVSYWAEYGKFIVDDEANNFKLLNGDYSGDAGDPLGALSGVEFTSKDNDNDDYADDNCAVYTYGGFWHDSSCNLRHSCAATAGGTYFRCSTLPDSNTVLIIIQMWLQCK